jgi:hypothetical protein
MATRSAIIVHDGTHRNYRGIYCHWDGYPEHNGVVLLQHYTDPDKVAELISLGSVSSLGPEIGEKHDFDSRDMNVCTFYGRDRGEEDVGATEFETLEQAVDYYDRSGCEYIYVFHPNDYEDWGCYTIVSKEYINLYDVRKEQEKDHA